ncbi:response regulator transcription factor [Azoarcus sp. PA01]|nr:response regulator transcription factor [Azoarcus sp. PA01]
MIITTESAIRVFLVDDHRTTLWGLERLIEGAERMQLAGSATSIAELLADPDSRNADVIVLDLDLGGVDSAAALAELQQSLSARVLVLTGARDADSHRRVVMAGARGVVRKEEPVDVLLRAIEKVHEGDVWVNRALIGDIMDMLKGGQQPAPDEHNAKISSLTPKELEVIAAVVRHKGAKSLVLAEDLGISEHTLRNHLTVIYHKLELRGRLELYVYAKEHGIGPAHS